MTTGTRFALSLVLLTASSLALADDTVSFATGGYANQVRTQAMMHKIDTNNDGMVSKAEWNAFQEKVFAMLDANNSATLDREEFMHAHHTEVASFATGGYANALQTSDMFAKLDTDHDGKVSREEFLAAQSQLFDRMDTGHTAMLDQHQFVGRGSAR
jgi:hypothetical protein